MFPSSMAFSRQTGKTLATFNPTKVDITFDGVPSEIYLQAMFSRHFFNYAYILLYLIEFNKAYRMH